MKNWDFILGVDVSRNTLDIYCWEKKEHICIKNDREGFKALKKWGQANSIDLSKSLLVLEFTGGYEYKLLQFCEAMGIAFCRLPGLAIKRSMGIVRGKNDKVDAMRIAQYADEKHNSIEPSKPLNNKIIELKALLQFRKCLVRENAAYQARVRERKHMYPDLKDDIIIRESNRKIKEGKAAQARVEQEIMKLIESDEAMKLNYKLITSIKGIGPVNGWMTIAYTENFISFPDARSYAVYVGVVPFEHSSGTSIKGRKRVSHLANKKLKSELSQAARSAIAWNKEIKEYAERKLKNKLWSIVANNVKFKLILRMFAVVKRGTKYVDKYEKAA